MGYYSILVTFGPKFFYIILMFFNCNLNSFYPYSLFCNDVICIDCIYTCTKGYIMKVILPYNIRSYLKKRLACCKLTEYLGSTYTVRLTEMWCLHGIKHIIKQNVMVNSFTWLTFTYTCGVFICSYVSINSIKYQINKSGQ